MTSKDLQKGCRHAINFDFEIARVIGKPLFWYLTAGMGGEAARLFGLSMKIVYYYEFSGVPGPVIPPTCKYDNNICRTRSRSDCSMVPGICQPSF